MFQIVYYTNYLYFIVYFDILFYFNVYFNILFIYIFIFITCFHSCCISVSTLHGALEQKQFPPRGLIKYSESESESESEFISLFLWTPFTVVQS